MLFMHPMWDNESQRIGKQKCSPIGYAMHGIAEYVGYAGFLVLLFTMGYLTYKAIAGTFHVALCWLLAVPFCLDVASEVLYQFSWLPAWRKGFRFDGESGKASWIEAGQRRTYKYPGKQ